MDNDQPKPLLGAPKRRGPKLPNPANVAQRERERVAEEAQRERARAAAAGIPPVQQGPVSAIPPFDRHSTISDEWTTRVGVIGPVIEQIGETCASVVLCYLLQAHFNQNKHTTLHHQFVIEDLTRYIEDKTSKLSFRNLNIALNYIVYTGLLSKRDGNTLGKHRIQGRFDTKMASRDDVLAKIVETPFGISLEDTRELQILSKEDIYNVPLRLQPQVERPKRMDHTVLAVAKGRDARTGLEFLVIQNSWGREWCNQGYARLLLHPDGVYPIFWPVEAASKLS